MSKLVLAIVVAAAAALTTAFAGIAQSDDPFAGLPAPTVTIAQAIGTGDASAVVGHLASSGIVKTAYPGGGEAVTRETAAADIAAAIVSSPDRSDSEGTGRYRLLAVWIPTADPSSVHLVGSGINAAGTRITTVFTVKDGAIIAYGRAVDTAATLAQFAKDGDLRLVPASPQSPTMNPPSVGTGTNAHPHASRSSTLVLVGLLLLITSAGAAAAHLFRFKGR